MVAEGRTERALELWSALPDNYEDVAARRKDLVAKAEAADRRDGRGQPLLRSGRRRPRRRRVGESRRVPAPATSNSTSASPPPAIKLGNLNLKRSYLREAGEEAARGNFDEALVLCRKVLELDPSDESALLVAKELEAKGRELAESEIREAPKVRKLPKVKPAAPLAERLHLRLILVTLAFLGVIALGIWFFFVHIPGVRAETAMKADKAFNEALTLKEAGKLSDAITPVQSDRKGLFRHDLRGESE